jgi:hypothetical protein
VIEDESSGDGADPIRQLDDSEPCRDSGRIARAKPVEELLDLRPTLFNGGAKSLILLVPNKRSRTE